MRARLNRSRDAGFTLVENLIVIAIIGLLGAIAVPNFVKARTESQAKACVENLHQIDGAKHAWVIETKQKSDAAPTEAPIFADGAYIRVKPGCPASGSYELNAVRHKPTCTIGAALSI
jgi:prepilin-type N-terminal cleavage/methylation domain-containing protein